MIEKIYRNTVNFIKYIMFNFNVQRNLNPISKSKIIFECKVITVDFIHGTIKFA